MREDFLPFHVPSVGPEEISAVAATLRSGWISTGPRVFEFEKAFAAFVDSEYAVGLNSCTAAMHLALEACGVGPGDEVILPTMTFAATAEAVLYLGGRPILVDSDPVTGNLDMLAVEAAIGNRTKAIIPVHLGGNPCDMNSLLALSDKHSLVVVEDAAHGPCAKIGDRQIGTLGDVGCFSFYATKPLTTGEGGMAVTRDPDLEARIRLMSLHGISRDAWKRYSKGGSWFYEIEDIGYKYNMTDIAASLGLVQLESQWGFLERRRHIAKVYQEELADLDGVELPFEREGTQCSWHLFILRLRKTALTIGRARFIEELKNLNIGSSVHFIPLHLHPYYRDRYDYEDAAFPGATDFYDRCLSLPIFPSMTPMDIADVIEAVRTIVQRNTR